MSARMLLKTKHPFVAEAGKAPQDRTLEELLRWGAVIIDKPQGPTSHQVSSWVKELLGVDRAAHGGTLDPRATGVLPIGVGNAVRAVDILHEASKGYVGVLRLHGEVPQQKLEGVLADFTGEIYQLPPVRSAVKRELRTRGIERLQLVERDGRDVLFEVDCEAGTYIRTLCVDLGDALGVGAHLQDLRRVRTAHLTERQAVTLHDLRDAVEYWRSGNERELRKHLHPMELLLSHLPRIEVKDSAVDAICHGAKLALPGIVAVEETVRPKGLVALFTTKGEAIAVGRAELDAEGMVRGKDGIAVDTERVLMEPDTYPRTWQS